MLATVHACIGCSHGDHFHDMMRAIISALDASWLEQCRVELSTNLPCQQGMTQPPPRLSERDLIALMERHNIGTDATVAEHIEKQLTRGYASKDDNLLFSPTPLGEALIGAYQKMGLDNVWKPDLRCGCPVLCMNTKAGSLSRCAVNMQSGINTGRWCIALCSFTWLHLKRG